MSHVADGELHAYLDGALDHLAPDRAEWVRSHLEECGACRARLEEERAVLERSTELLAMAAPPEAAPPPFEEIRRRARDLEELEGAGGSAGGPRRRVGPRALAWAATVVVALGAGWVVRGLQESGPAVLRMPAEEAAPTETRSREGAAAADRSVDEDVELSPAATADDAAGAGPVTTAGGASGGGEDAARRSAPPEPPAGVEGMILPPPPQVAAGEAAAGRVEAERPDPYARRRSLMDSLRAVRMDVLREEEAVRPDPVGRREAATLLAVPPAEGAEKMGETAAMAPSVAEGQAAPTAERQAASVEEEQAAPAAEAARDEAVMQAPPAADTPAEGGQDARGESADFAPVEAGAEPVSPTVPDFPVVSRRRVALGEREAVETVQRLPSGEEVTLRWLAAGEGRTVRTAGPVAPPSLWEDPLPAGWGEAVLRRPDGWLGARGPLPEDALLAIASRAR